MIIGGIDPGINGGIAISSGDNMYAYKMPETEKDICELILTYPLKAIFLESVHSMPGQGVASSFKFGRGYGFLRGIITALEIPLHDVSPQKWQKFIGCLTKGDKNVSKQKAQQLFPKLKITHATADAILIAEYGRRTIV